MGRSTIRAKMYRSSSHRDVRYDGEMKTVDKGEGGDKTEGAITCGEMRADGWGQYRYSLEGQQSDATYKHGHIQYIFLIIQQF